MFVKQCLCKILGANKVHYGRCARGEWIHFCSKDFVVICIKILPPSTKYFLLMVFILGTYGNRQVLSVDTNGPFTHVFDF